MKATISIRLAAALRDDLDQQAAADKVTRSTIVETAIREYLDRRRIAAAERWHASLVGDDAATRAAFGAAP